MLRCWLETLVFCGSLLVVAANYETLYITQKVNNFGFGSNDTFQLRVLLSDEHWNRSQGPIFLYTGNEGPITDFADNTGFMWDIAAEYQAMVVFAEHRYYGESKPIRKPSDTNAEYYRFLSTEETLADFSQVIWYLKHQYQDASQSPVIAFGGSYGAMLAVWLRLKYPHLVQGVISSSAPLNFDSLNGTTCGLFGQTVTRAFERRSSECVKTIRHSWQVINHFNKTDEGRNFLSNTFHLCSKISTEDDFVNFKSWLNSGFSYSAMTDYPTHANFMAPLPAYPTKEICKYLTNSSLESDELMESLYNAISVYYNYTGSANCSETNQTIFDSSTEQVWEYQTCTELTIPECNDGIKDMFESNPWDYESFSDYCYDTFGVTPSNDSLLIQYGNISLIKSSNIVFSNGEFDPWSGQGILTNLSDSIISIWIKDAAHHTDLRSFNPDDPPSVIEARNTEKHYISKWIQEWTRANHQ